MNYGKVEEPSSSPEPIPKYGETRCYIRDPDGYLIEVGQSTTVKYG
jgi:catechol 2,3-dioxygenase-like lactoylglutathione lyase family enzyme